MSYSNYNPNPAGRSVGDCSVRAVALATGKDWDSAYVSLAAAGLDAKDLPNADSVWGGYLIKHGFRRHVIEDVPENYTVADFARDNPSGLFVLSMPGRHVVTVIDGDYYDSWDSGAEVPVYYYARE